MAYMVTVKESYLPAGNKALGIGQAWAIFKTRKEALKWIIRNGKGASCEVTDDGMPWDLPPPKKGKVDEITGLTFDGTNWK